MHIEVCPEKVQPLLIWREWFVQHRGNLAAKESGLECVCGNSDNLVHGGCRCCRVTVCTVWLLHSKWLGRARNLHQTLIISPWKLFGWLRGLQLWATGDWQFHHDNASTHASCLMQRFLAKHQTTQVTQPHYSPNLAPCNFGLFPKLKSPLKGKIFQTFRDNSGAAANGNWEN